MSKTDPWGVEQTYLDAREEWHTLSAATNAKLHEAMGANGAAEPPDPRLRFVKQGERAVLDSEAELQLEDGTVVRGAGRELPPDLPLGYHTLRQRNSGTETHLIVAPTKCFEPEGLHTWGWALQLYSLRSKKSWGIGDFADLREFCRWAIDEFDAGMIMTNPLAAVAPGVPQQASPYSPTSRIFRNLLYLCIEDISGAREHIENLEDLARRGADLSRLPTIDRDEIYRLKAEALERLWSAVRDRVDLAHYEREQGKELELFAAYCVLAEKYGTNWRRWPGEFQHPNRREVTDLMNRESDRIRFHKWVQLCLEKQLGDVSRKRVIMQDLPIGVDPDGADAWMWQDIFAQGVSVGAPPDIFNTQGQDWGLQPFVPHKLRAANYVPFIRTIRAHMRHSTGLRIDHVMGLFRLFWIPAGTEKKKGAYVRYRHDEMLSIVALESQRAQSYVVGEDLGTVETGVRETLAERGVFSYRVMWFEEEHPRTYPVHALAAVTTHDLPTIAGLWTGADLKEQQKRGLKPNVDATRESRESFKRIAGIDENTPLPEVALRAYTALAEAPSAVIVASMEDALCVEQRPNLPGTLPGERPNWSIPLPQPLEEIERNEEIRTLANVIRRVREKRTGSEKRKADGESGYGRGRPNCLRAPDRDFPR